MAKDRTDRQMLEAVTQTCFQIKLFKELLKDNQTGKGGELLIFKAKDRKGVGFAVKRLFDVGFMQLQGLHRRDGGVDTTPLISQPFKNSTMSESLFSDLMRLAVYSNRNQAFNGDRDSSGIADFTVCQRYPDKDQSQSGKGLPLQGFSQDCADEKQADEG